MKFPSIGSIWSTSIDKYLVEPRLNIFITCKQVNRHIHKSWHYDRHSSCCMIHILKDVQCNGMGIRIRCDVPIATWSLVSRKLCPAEQVPSFHNWWHPSSATTQHQFSSCHFAPVSIKFFISGSIDQLLIYNLCLFWFFFCCCCCGCCFGCGL